MDHARNFDKTLPCRVDAFLLSDCKAAAKADGRTLGDWVRRTLMAALAHPQRSEKKAASRKSSRKT